MGVRRLNAGTRRRTELGIDLEQSAKEVLAYVKWEAKLLAWSVMLPGQVDVKRIRTNARKSRAANG